MDRHVLLLEDCSPANITRFSSCSPARIESLHLNKRVSSQDTFYQQPHLLEGPGKSCRNLLRGDAKVTNSKGERDREKQDTSNQGDHVLKTPKYLPSLLEIL